METVNTDRGKKPWKCPSKEIPCIKQILANILHIQNSYVLKAYNSKMKGWIFRRDWIRLKWCKAWIVWKKLSLSFEGSKRILVFPFPEWSLLNFEHFSKWLTVKIMFPDVVGDVYHSSLFSTRSLWKGCIKISALSYLMSWGFSLLKKGMGVYSYTPPPISMSLRFQALRS